jgi:hypothetical protein
LTTEIAIAVENNAEENNAGASGVRAARQISVTEEASGWFFRPGKRSAERIRAVDVMRCIPKSFEKTACPGRSIDA